MGKTLGIVIAAIALAICSAAGASPRRDWEALSPDEQLGYAFGTYDGLLITNAGDEYGEADSAGTLACIQARPLSMNDLRTLINDGYTRDPSSLELPAAAILAQQLGQRCRSEINRERQRHNLIPLRAR